MKQVLEHGKRRDFKRWVLDNVWATRCIKGHVETVAIDWMYVNQTPPHQCFACNEELYYIRKNVAHLVYEGLIPAWYPSAAARNILKNGRYYLYAVGDASADILTCLGKTNSERPPTLKSPL